jgi:hypothetical protein
VRWLYYATEKDCLAKANREPDQLDSRISEPSTDQKVQLIAYGDLMVSGEEFVQWSPLAFRINLVVFHAETILRFPSNLQQGQPPTSDRVVTTMSLVRILDILTRGFEFAPHVSKNYVRPLFVGRMMLISTSEK